MLTTKEINNVLGEINVNPKNLWYVPHPGIRTQTARKRAIEIEQWIVTGQPLEKEPDENELFIAMHTCAFRASRRDSNNKNISRQARQEWARRWEQIREYIVEQNLGLVYSTIGRFGTKILDEDDLLSDGMLALNRAIDRFNPWRGFKFSTYACNVIVRALMRRGKVEGNYRRLFPVQHDYSYERPDPEPDINTELVLERLNKVMDQNLGELTELEYNILEQRFPPDRRKRLTFQKIGDRVGLSKERGRQIQNGALQKLREVLEADPVLQ
jgi:RNA polymerase primary sigma factor